MKNGDIIYHNKNGFGIYKNSKGTSGFCRVTFEGKEYILPQSEIQEVGYLQVFLAKGALISEEKDKIIQSTHARIDDLKSKIIPKYIWIECFESIIKETGHFNFVPPTKKVLNELIDKWFEENIN